MELEHLSASRIETFYQCQRQYYAKYELKLPDRVHPLTKMGSSVHDAFETVTQEIVDGKAFDQDYLESLVKVRCEVRGVPEHSKLAAELSGNAVDWGYFRNLSKCVGTEVKFEEELPDGTKVTGFIDRLDVSTPDADIMDLKTQKRLFEENVIRERWQSRIYDWAARRIRPEVTGRTTISYWVLRHRVQRAQFTAGDSPETERMLIETAEEIRSCEEPEAKPTALCQWCPMKGKCVEGDAFLSGGAAASLRETMKATKGDG